EADAARIAGTARAGGGLICHARDSYRKRVDVVGLVDAGAVGELNHAGAQQGRGYVFLDRGGIGETIAFIVEKEISLPAQQARRQRTTQSTAEAVAMGRRQRRVRQPVLRIRRMIVAPQVGGAYVACEVIIVK